MNRPIIKFIADFGPLLIFFVIYFNNENNLKLAIPPFIVATLIALVAVYILEKRIPIVPLVGGILITLFDSFTSCKDFKKLDIEDFLLLCRMYLDLSGSYKSSIEA